MKPLHALILSFVATGFLLVGGATATAGLATAPLGMISLPTI